MWKKLIIATAVLTASSIGFTQQPVQESQKDTEVAQKETQAAKPSPEEQMEKLRKVAQGRLGVKVEHVLPTPIPGVYELAVNNEIIYMDATGDHVIMGDIFNTLSRKNLTQEAKEKLHTIKFSELPLKDAIKTVHGNGSRQLAVFSDPNCTYCKILERDLAKLNDITIYTFLYPVITSSSRDASANIWCAKDPVKAWKEALIDNKPAPKRDGHCDISVLDRNIELGAKYGVTGTPTVFVPSGKRAPGAVGIDYLERLLSESKSSQ